MPTTDSIIPALEYPGLADPTGSIPDAECLRTIGLGSCGTVFEIPGTELAYKKGTAGIWGDFCLTNKVHNAVRDVRDVMHKAFPNSVLPKTPLCHAYHTTSDDEFWVANLPLFPEDHRTKQPLFLVDRILPLPLNIRERLIKLYFDQDEAVQKEARNNEENEHCLVRVYLGERTSHSHHPQEYDTLHWEACVDGMDTEFVIGSSATWDLERPRGYDNVDSPPHNVKAINFKRRPLHLWMLDFDKATRIELTEHDVDKKLVPAFLGNDPYYPRPQVDEELWDEFCKVYLEASEVILLRKKVKKGVKHLPQRFLDEVVKVSKEHEDWNEEDNIVFAN